MSKFVEIGGLIKKGLGQKVVKKFSENSFARKNEQYKLLSGVPVMVGIITGKRSFMDYFLTPFITGTSFALSER